MLTATLFAGNWIHVIPADSIASLEYKSGREKITQFGNFLIVMGDNEFSEQARMADQIKSFPLRETERIYLLTSKDPAILKAIFPGVRVIWEGFGMKVIIAGETAATNLKSKASAFTKIEQLPENTTLLSKEILCKQTIKNQPDDMSKFLNQLEMPFFKKDLKELIAFKTRYSYVEGAQKAINYCEKVLADSGYKTEQLPFNIGSTRVSNLKATIAGTDEQKYGQVLIVAHLDSTSNNPKYDAPGADDNGTGSAAVLSIARMFKKAKIKPLATVHFILFLGEEQGLYGSKAYVNNLSAEEKRKIKAVLNMDMIGFDKTPPLSVLLETNSFNRPMAEIIQKLGQKYAEISLRTSYNAWGSDHAPFLQHGIPAVLTIESEFAANPNYHKTTDLFEFVNFDLCLNIIRLNAATAYYYAVEKR
jgi:hypothetical protein